MSGGGGSSTTTQKADPWKEVQPYLKELYGQGQEFFQQGPQDFYPQQTYLDPNNMQRSSIDMLGNYGAGLGGMQGNMFGALDQGLGGYNAMMGAYGGGLGQSAGVYGDLMGQGGPQFQMGDMGNSQAAQALRAQMMGSNNPYLDQQVKTAQESMADTFNTKVMSNIRDEGIFSGQYGGSNQKQAIQQGADTLQKNMGNVATQMYGNAYQQDQARALQAANAGLGMEFGIGGQNLGAGQFNRNMRLNAAQGLGQQYQGGLGIGQGAQTSALGLAPSIYQAGTMPAEFMGRAGGLQAGFDQKGLDEAMQRYAYPQQSQMDMMNWYSGLLNGATPYGSQIGSTSGGSNDWLTGLGSMAMLYGGGRMGGWW